MKILLNNAPQKFKPTFKKVADVAMQILGQPKELSVVATFVDGEEIRQLNSEYRGIDKVTDVLSFPTIDNVGHGVIDISMYPFETDCRTGYLNLGDIFICMDVAEKQAEEYGHSLKRESAFLFLHGLLHLLGYDHIEQEDEIQMKQAANEILSACKIER